MASAEPGRYTPDDPLAGDCAADSGRRLLIVEPEPLLRWSLVTYLRRWFEVFAVDSDAAAQRVLDEQSVDAVVVSDQLSDKDVEEIEAHARSRNTGTRVVRTVISRREGVTPWIEKPFDLAELAVLLGIPARH
ncbi:MAG: hypothetical protein HY763_09205 [Planctomycetes bacterium]|nr:hypothetical protein [Planctomycetota bacterium]